MEPAGDEGAGHAVEPGADEAQAMFNRQLATYRKVVSENLMYHREVYDIVGKVLAEESPAQFKFLDIACGDASASAAMLARTAIGHYHGIDLSARSLELARQTLAALPCKADLQCRDFSEAMADWTEPVDVVWIGMSLHHLQLNAKSKLMQDVHRALTRSGRFLIWEPTFLDGEDRGGWIGRFSSYRAMWAALTDDEFATMEDHMRLADFPETADTWTTMGRQAGFAHVQELYTMPNRMGRVFKYWN